MTDPNSQTERIRGLLRDEAGDPTAWSRGATSDEADSRIDLLIRGELAPDEAEALAQRLIDEPELGLQARIAAALAQAQQEEDTFTVSTTPRNAANRWPWALGFAVAAAALAVVLVRPPTLEPIDGSGIRSGVSRTLKPANGSAVLQRDAFVLEWTGGPPTAVYELFVTTAELKPVYQARNLLEAHTVVPPTALQEFDSGTNFLWRVVAVTEDGRRVHSTAFEVVLE